MRNLVKLSLWFITLILGSLTLIYGLAFFSWQRLQTRFAPGFSVEAFFRIRPGETTAQVVKRLGNPLSVERFRKEGERWCYTLIRSQSFEARELMSKMRERGLKVSVDDTFEACILFDATGKATYIPESLASFGVTVGTDRESIERVLGKPLWTERPAQLSRWNYSAPKDKNGSYEWWYILVDEQQRVVGRFYEEWLD